MDWNNAKSLTAAWSELADGQELWLKAETYDQSSALVTDKAIALRGGFVGNETSPDERMAGSVTVFSGGKTVPSDDTALLKFTAASGTVVLENLAVVESFTRGVEVSGGASAALVNCRLIGNGARKMSVTADAITGRGAYLKGKSGATAAMTNCYIALNRLIANDSYFDDSGAGAYVTAFDRFELVGTTFASNGIPYQSTLGRDKTRAGALYVNATPVTASNCTFFANGCICRSGSDGGIVFLNGNCGGSVFRNSRWVANFHHHWMANSHGSAGGALVLNQSGSCTLENCTVAYNFLRGASCAPGVTVMGGDLIARNSIFWGNLRTCTAGSAGASDVFVKGTGTALLDTCLVGGTDAQYLSAATGAATPVLTGGTAVGDPLFATTAAEFLETINGTNLTLPFTADTDTSPCYAKKTQTLRYDVHLRSKTGRWTEEGRVTDEEMSPAVDAAVATLDVGEEPSPNGERRNLGCYGGTPEAAFSLDGTPAVASAALDVSTTEPVMSATLGGSGEYRAMVWFCHGATAGEANSTNGWARVRLIADGVSSGAELSDKARWHYAPGSSVSWRVVVKAGSKVASAGGTETISPSAEYPAWWNAGGGEGVLHVWSQATENGSSETGESWRNAFSTFDAALAAADADHAEIWIAGSPALSDDSPPDITVPIFLRGGFTGGESDAESRPEGTRAVLDGRNVRNDILRLAYASGTAVIERVDFVKSKQHGLVKSGAGSMEIRSCRFDGNGSQAAAEAIVGRGANLQGGTESTLLVSNCVFNANRINMGDCHGSDPYQSGCGAYVKTFRRFDLVDTVFSSNGCQKTMTSGRDGTHGYAIEINSAPTFAKRCDFRANMGHLHYGTGSIVTLRGGCGGSVFENCLWTGNSYNYYSSRTATQGGALEVWLSKSADTCTLSNCTIAYNLCDAAKAAAGLHVSKGTVEVANSIIWGNAVDSTYNKAACDIYVSDAASSVTIHHSAIAAESTVYHAAVGENGIVYGEGNVLGDPLFATTVEEFSAAVEGGGGYPTTGTPSIFKASGAHGAFDLHLRSAKGRWNGVDFSTADGESSKAIDKAEESLPVGDEPSPNGDRRNLGRYGGTAEASMSLVGGQPAVDSLTVNESYDYTQPAIGLVLGGTGAYAATVTCCFGTELPEGTGAEGWQTVRTLDALPNGSEATVPALRYFEQGARVYWRVIVEAKGAATVVRDGSYEVSGSTPPFYGHGGGENVVHLRPTAKGAGTGGNWADAVTTFEEAVAKLTPVRNEIWIEGSLVRTEEPALVHITVPTVLCGGFDGTEDAIGDRALDRVTAFDGDQRYQCLKVAVAEGVTLTVKDVVFRRSSKTALLKSGNGKLQAENCRFTDNCWRNALATDDGEKYNGGGANLSGGNNTFTNCLFDGNCERRACTYGVHGFGIYSSECALEVVGCAFLTNGLATAIASGSGDAGPLREGCKGTAIFAEFAPALKIVGSRFVGNRGTSHAGGEVVGLSVKNYTNHPKYVVSNCLFVANQGRNWVSTGSVYKMGCICASGSGWEGCPCDLVVDGCTFAYNVNASASAAAGITVTASLQSSPVALSVRNCIFTGNVRSSAVKESYADLYLRGSVDLTMDYTLLAATNAPYCRLDGIRSCTIGDHLVLADDAKLATTRREMMALLADDITETFPTAATRISYRAEAADWAWNGHLRGSSGYVDEITGTRQYYRGKSPAIDAGDPTYDFRLEPEPNGRRINLGAYGGTPWATGSGAGLKILIR